MSKEPTYDYDVFIFYADADEYWAEGTLIPNLGVAKKRIITRQKINPGAFTGKEFDNAISNSRYIILVLSPSYFADKWSSYTEGLASYISDIEQHEHLIYLLLRPCNLPHSIQAHGYIDYTKEEDWQKQNVSLNVKLKRKKPKQRLIPCPYPGLPPFSEESSEYFFGRKHQIEEFIIKLDFQNYFFIIGPSGSGKSSFVSAGVIPELHKQMPHQWYVKSMRPGKNPMGTLMNEFGLTTTNVPSSIREYTELIQTIIAHHPPSKSFLLFIDQFEELFVQTEKKPDQLAFIAALKNLSQVKICKLVLAMRADFYGELMDSTLWPISERLDIAPLRGAELKDAIVNPAQSLKVDLERDLVERLLSDAAEEPGVLPLIQATMTSLWRKRNEYLLTLHSYEELGRSYKEREDSSLSGLAIALIAMADGAYNELTNDAQKKIAQRIFLRLIQFGEGRADIRRDIRRQLLVEDLKAEDDDPVLFEQTLGHLTDKRLLTLSGEEKHGSKKVDIAHEALITGWPKLKSWIDERQEAEQTRRRLEANATEWLRLDRRGGLLDSVELLEAERWLANPYASVLGGYSDNLQALIEESRKQNRRLEEMYKNSERDRAEAEQQRRIALARQLGAQAELLRNQQGNLLERSVLLAIESMKRFPTLETAHTLRQGLSLLRLRITTLTHEDTVKMVVFSPRGDFIATASDDHTAKIWNVTTGQLVFTLKHKEPVRAVVFSHDGSYIATASDDQTVIVREMTSGKQQILTLQDCVKDVTFSPDGQYIATACDDSSVGIWRLTSDQAIAHIRHEDPVNALAFSPDGRYLASASWDTTVKITEVDNQNHFATLLHENGVLKVAFSSDGQYLITSGADKFAYLWNMWKANLDSQLPIKLPHEDIVNAAVFSKDNLQVATGSLDHTACVWETVSGRLIARMSHAGSVNAVTFSLDGKYLATASDDRTAAVWETTSGKQVASLTHERAVKTVVFSPNNAYIVSASEDCTARVWEMAGNHLFIPLLHEGFVHSVAFSPHGDYVVTSSEDNTARVWTTSSGRELQRLEHKDVVNVAVISLNGEYVITASHDKTAAIWDIYTGKLVISLPHMDKVYDIAVSLNSKYFITACWDGTGQAWELPSGQPIATLHHQNLVYAVAISPNGKYGATASWDKTVGVWEILARREEPSFTLRHSEKVKHVTFSSDGNYIVTASDDHTAIIWRVVDGQQICVLQHDSNVDFVAFSPNSEYIATASADSSARIWDIEGNLISRLPHEQAVFSVAWSSSGRYLATASYDKTAGIWEASSGHQVVRLNHQDYVFRVAFSPDERFIATASKDGTAKIWLWKPDDLIDKACQYLTRDLSLEEWRQYLGNEPYHSTRKKE